MSSYFTDSPVLLAQEIDGVRIISCLEQVYMVRDDPGSVLLDAYNDYKVQIKNKIQSNSYKTIELIEQLGENIQKGIISLIKSARHEWDISLQIILLKAAMYGRSFFQINDTNFFYKTCQDLRVLNNLRSELVSIPLTFNQYFFLILLKGIKEVLHLHVRLLTRKLFTLAYEICNQNNNYTCINHVLTAWAQDKILYSKLSEKNIADEILKILSTNAAVPVGSIVDAAVNLKKFDIATKLVEFNSPPGAIVCTLLKIGNINKAIMVSVDSGDPCLIYSVIIYMKNNFPQNEFLLKLSSNPYLNSLGIKISHQQTAISYMNLFQHQAIIEKKINSQISLVGLSTIGTIAELCKFGNVDEAIKIKNEFSVSQP
ncbi:hypothetical protein MXB_263, partial [Myxobolus squamalis]